MGQYTENSPGCSAANYTNVGGMGQYTTQSWKPFLVRRTLADRIGTVTDRIGTQTTVRLTWKIDLCQSLCNRRHTLSVLRFLLPKKPEPIHFLRSMRSYKSFSFFFNFSCEDSFFFGQSSKHLSADRLRCEHRLFYMVTSVGLNCFVHTRNPGPRGELLTKQTSFLVQPYARLARIALQHFTNLVLPATISLTRLHETHVRTRHKAIFKRCASEPTQDKLTRDKMADMIAAGAHVVSSSWL